MSAMKILLIRHGEVGDAYRGRFIGITDPPLSESGRAGCLALRERVAALSPARFFASPLRRAAETLELVMPSGAEARRDRFRRVGESAVRRYFTESVAGGAAHLGRGA